MFMLISTLSFITVERGVQFYITVSFYSISHTLEHYFSRVFQKPPRFWDKISASNSDLYFSHFISIFI